MSNKKAIDAILAANTPLKAARYAVDNPPAREIGALLDRAIADHDTIARLQAELDAAHAALRRIRRLIEAEERPGDRTAEIYDAAGKALPY